MGIGSASIGRPRIIASAGSAATAGVFDRTGRVYAGSGVTPGSIVTIYVAGAQVGTATADGHGNWLYTFASAPSAGALVTAAKVTASTIAPGPASSHATFPNATGYMFATHRLRTPTVAPATVAASNVYSLHVLLDVSPPYPTNKYRFAYPAHWTSSTAVPSETALANPYTILGATMLAQIDGVNWTVVAVRFAGAAAVTVDPTVDASGVLSDDIVFGTDLPPNTPYQIRTYVTAAQGAQMPASIAVNRVGTIEGAKGDTSDTLGGQLTSSGALVGPNDGRLGGVLGPCFVVCKAPAGIDRHVVWINGDSIGWGKNSNTNQLCTARGVFGFLSMAFDDDTRSQRMVGYNMCLPGVGVAEIQNRPAMALKLNLIKKVPNRPYTMMVCEHYNNGFTGDYATVARPSIVALYTMLLAESAAWGDAPCALYQSRPIPRPCNAQAGVTPVSQYDFCTSLALQGTDTTNTIASNANRWQLDADLVANGFPQLAGAINANRDYAYDQATNRDKVQVLPFASTLAAPTSTSSNLVQLTSPATVGQTLVFNPGGTGEFESNVVSVSGNNAVLDLNPTAVIASGAPVSATLVGDPAGLHPASAGHTLIAQAVIDWKTATIQYS